MPPSAHVPIIQPPWDICGGTPLFGSILENDFLGG